MEWLTRAAHWQRSRAHVWSPFCAAALPIAVVAAVLSATGSTSPRFHPRPPPLPSPWLVARAEGSVAGACQLAVRVLDDGDGIRDAPLMLSRVTAAGVAERVQASSDRNGGHRFLDLTPGTY